MIEEPIEDADYDRILEQQDFFPKIFLQPSEIRLDKDQGIRVIKRHPNHPDKFSEEEVSGILLDERQIKQFSMVQEGEESVVHPAGNGLLSLFKRTKERRIKLAICICVYSEAKHMLKSTIKGIQESNKDFLQRAGIMSHEIIVVVIFDGIEHLNNSKDQTENMISFFNEIDIKNGFRQRTYSMALDEFLKDIEQNRYDPNQLDDRLPTINLFTEEELQELKPRLFENQYSQYIETKNLLKDISRLKLIKDLRMDQLPLRVMRKYEQICVNYCAQNNYWFQTQEEIQEYMNARRNTKFKLMFEALSEVEDLCERYLDSRQDKTILYPVRMEKDDYLKNPRQIQNAEEEFSSLIDEAERKEYNYMFMCVKHKNEGKLNSHMLFFQGFCKIFDPEYCMLMDVGVKPQGDAIYRMYEYMELNQKCGGVCGYMSLKIENPADDLGYRLDGYNEDDLDCCTKGLNYFFSIQRTQQFEYHYAHMLDKPFESFFNYIHVLPGAFSGYRWKALKSVRYTEKEERDEFEGHLELQTERYTAKSDSTEEQDSETLLKRYLKTALQDHSTMSLEDSNMYLAEDRILCLGIQALGYDLHYLPDVESYVDPVTSLTKLLGQRRRWINGSWFAFNYVREHSDEIDSCLFMVQLLYYSFVQKLQWISPALFYVAMNLTLISFVTNSVVPAFEDFFKLSEDFQLYNYNILWIFNIRQMVLSIPDIINFLYIIAVLSIVVWSALVNHNNRRFKVIYYGASTLLGVYGILVLALLIYNAVSIIQQTQGQTITQDFIIPLIYLRVLILFVIIGFALPILWTLSFRKTIEMVTSLLSYIYYSPTYINIVQTFAFARIDDLSWGTKGLDMEANEELSRDWERRKYVFILQYIATNGILAYVLIALSRWDYPRNIIILATAILVVFLLAFRIFFAFFWIVKYYCMRACQKLPSYYLNQNRANGHRVYNALKLIELKIKEIEKERTKRKKQEEFKNMASATSVILSKALTNFGRKIRNKVAKHIVHNNMVTKKELLNPFKKRLKGSRPPIQKKEIKPIQEVEERSESNDKGLSPEKSSSPNKGGPSPNRGSEEQLVNESENHQPSPTKSPKKDMKSILSNIRERYKSKLKSRSIHE